MKYALDSRMSKEIDRYTIEEIGTPSIVLMERAAMSVAGKCAQVAKEFNRSVRICAVCGCGNNGADGIAAARILTWQGLEVDIIIAGNEEHATTDFSIQKKIAVNSGMNFRNIAAIPEYDIVIDAVFGVGLKRNVEGEYGRALEMINAPGKYVISVDVPSGIDASTGQIMNVAVRANATVTFGYNKLGLMLYPGKEYAGEVTVSDIGFYPEAVKKLSSPMYFTIDDLSGIPERIMDSNKGTYGRILVIAGSENMSGAAFLAAKAAYRSGAGLVEIFTHENNVTALKALLPEAIITGYNEKDCETKLPEALIRAGVVLVGPGLSKSDMAKMIVKRTVDEKNVPIIIDADALNIIAEDLSILMSGNGNVIITPHIGEMSRLTGLSSYEIKRAAIDVASDFSKKYNCICVLKDAVTVASENAPGNRVYINNSGCAALAKGGSGDVLTGVIAGMLSLKLEPFSAACMGVYIHGLAGELAGSKVGMHSVLAGEVVDSIGSIINRRN